MGNLNFICSRDAGDPVSQVSLPNDEFGRAIIALKKSAGPKIMTDEAETATATNSQNLYQTSSEGEEKSHKEQDQ